MHVERVGRQLIVQAPAKLNLFLEVLGRRDDGFHELETLICPVSLYDTLYFEPCDGDPPGEIDFSSDWRPLARSGRLADRSGELPAELPPDRHNLVVRALDLLRQQQASPQGARVRLIKRIPAAAGMAGGSSDAAAALVLGNLGWEMGLSHAELARLAAQLGSDVPFFLTPGAALCTGRGEHIENVQLNNAGWFVIVRPTTGLATAEVFRACRPSASPRSVSRLISALQTGGWERAGRELFNALGPAAETLNAEVSMLRHEFDQLDVLGHQMSGSGTSYFAICRHARHARQLAARLRNRGWGHVYAVRGCL